MEEYLAELVNPIVKEENDSPYLKKREDDVLDTIFLKTKCYDGLSVTNCHPQMRDATRFCSQKLFFCSYKKLSTFDLEDETVVDDIIPEKYQKNKEISAFKITKNLLLWSYEYSNLLQVINLRSGKVFSISTIPVNSITTTREEDRVFVVGQSRTMLVYEYSDREGFVEKKELHQELYSAVNFVAISPDQNYISVVTDGRGFSVFKYFRSDNFEDVTVHFREYVPRSGCKICDMCDWSCDSRHLVVASFDEATIFNVNSKSIVARVDVDRTSFVRFSPSLPDVFCVCNRINSAYLVKFNLSFLSKEKKIQKYSILPHFEEILKRNLRVSIVSMDFSENGDRIFISFNREGILEGELMPGPLRKLGDVGRFQRMLKENVKFRDVIVIVDIV